MLAKVTSLSKQSATYGLGTFLNQGLAFFLLPLYTRFLSRAEYGINGSVTALVGVLSILLTLSLETAVARFYYDLERDEDRRCYFGLAWLSLAGFGLVICLLLEAAGGPLFEALFQDVPFRPYGRLAIWGAYAGLAGVIPSVMFRVREKPRHFVAFSVSQFLVRILLNILFVVALEKGVEGIFAATLAANLLYAVPYTWVAWRGSGLRHVVSRAGPADWRRLRESLAYALPFIPQRLSNWALNVSDRIVAGWFVPLDELGLYTVGYRFGLMLAALLDAVNLAWAPFYFKTAGEPRGRESLARLCTYYVFGLTFLTLGTVLLSREVLYLVADPRFHPSDRVVPPVALAYGLHGVYLMMVSGPSYAKRTARLPLWAGISAILNIGMNLALIPKYGIMVAAWSTLAAFAVRAALVAWDSLRTYPLPYEGRRLALSAALGLVLMSGWWIDVGNLWANLGLKTLVLGAYPTVLRFALLRPEEVRGLEVVRRRLLARLTGRAEVLRG